jgi:hypothetical protein
MAGLNIGKAKKVLGSTFVENHDKINEDEAAHLIVRAEQKIKDLEDEMGNDEQLNAANQVVKDLKSGYNNAIKYERAKIHYLLSKIEEIQDGSVNDNSSV